MRNKLLLFIGFISLYLAIANAATSVIVLPQVSASRFSTTALWLYFFGMLFSLINILNIFYYTKFERIITGIKHFTFSLALGLFAASLIALSLYYTSTISIPSYDITNSTGTIFTVNSISLTTQALSTDRTLALFSLGIISIDIFSTLIFIYLLFFGNKRRGNES